MKPTKQQIDKEIAALKDVKSRIKRQYSYFGDDHYEAIDAQVEVLEARLTDEDIDEREDAGEWSDHAISNAHDAVSWLEGDYGGSLAADWEGLAS